MSSDSGARPQPQTKRVLGIEPGERLLVALLFGQYFFTGIASALTQTAGFALFLGSFDASQLPYTFILMGMIISVLTMIYMRVGQRIGFANQLRLNLAGQITVTAAFALGLTLSVGSWLVFALPILFQIVVVFGNMAFWSLAGRMLNVQQGKRLFGVVGTGEWLGMVLTGLMAPVLVPLVGLQTLFWVAAAAMGISLGAMNLNMRRNRHLLSEAAPPVAAPAARGTAAPDMLSILRNRYVLGLFALSMAWWIGFFFIDNIFYHEAAQQIPGAEELAAFIGLYLGGVGIVALGCNLLVAGPVLSRFGLKWSLMVLPAGLGVGALVMAATGVVNGPALLLFGAAVATKVWSVGLGFSVDQAARSVLFQPFSAALRTRVQTLVDGVAQPLSTAAAGVLLLLLGSVLSSSSLPLVYGLLVVVLVHLGIVVLVYRGYGKALIETLKARRLTGSQLVVNDATSLTILRDGLNSAQPGAVVYAMRLLAAVDRDALAAELPRLLTHKAPDVRRAALGHVGDLDLKSAMPGVRAALGVETSPGIVGAGLRTLARLGDRSEALAYLEGSDLSLKGQAVIALIESGDGDAGLRAEAVLAELVASRREAERLEAASILNETTSARTVTQLQGLLADKALPVQRMALRAAGRRAEAALWTQVVEAVRQRPTRNAALSALVAGGNAALPAIGKALRSGVVATHDLAALARAAGRIGSADAIPMLLPHAESLDGNLRGAAFRALLQCGYRPGPAEMVRLHDWIRNEARQAARLSAVEVDLEGVDAAALTRDALAEQVLRCRERILTLLSLGGDAAAIARATDSLSNPDPRQRAYALEVVDIATPMSLKPVVLPVLDELSPAVRLKRLSAAYPQGHKDGRERLEELSANEGQRVDAWTQASAAHALSLLDAGANQTTEGGRRLLSTIEKTIILRSVSIFSETSDEVLADVAAIAGVVETAAGGSILRKGDAGDSMYVIASGRVRVHDDAHEVAQLGPGDVFGEMALIDPETRSASVTAAEDTVLLQLDQAAFFELVDDRPEVARGLLRVLSRRLREAI